MRVDPGPEQRAQHQRAAFGAGDSLDDRHRGRIVDIGLLLVVDPQVGPDDVPGGAVERGRVELVGEDQFARRLLRLGQRGSGQDGESRESTHRQDPRGLHSLLIPFTI